MVSIALHGGEEVMVGGVSIDCCAGRARGGSSAASAQQPHCDQHGSYEAAPACSRATGPPPESEPPAPSCLLLIIPPHHASAHSSILSFLTMPLTLSMSMKGTCLSDFWWDITPSAK